MRLVFLLELVSMSNLLFKVEFEDNSVAIVSYFLLAYSPTLGISLKCFCIFINAYNVHYLFDVFFIVLFL